MKMAANTKLDMIVLTLRHESHHDRRREKEHENNNNNINPKKKPLAYFLFNTLNSNNL